MSSEPLAVAYARLDPRGSERLCLALTAPRRGHTRTLVWQAADGAVVPAGTLLYRAASDAEEEDCEAFTTPFPGRVRVTRPADRYVPPGPVGEFVFGRRLERELRAEARLAAQRQGAIASLRDEIVQLQASGAQPLVPLAALAACLQRQLDAARARQEAPLGPADLLVLVHAAFLLETALRGPQRPPQGLAWQELEKRARHTLGKLEAWLTGSAGGEPQPPPAARPDAQVYWQYLFEHLQTQLADHGLQPQDGLWTP